MTTEHWTDERLDRLAALSESNTQQIHELRDSIVELRESSREQRADISELRESIAGQQVTLAALMQLAAQDQQKWAQAQERWERFEVLHRENDERFNIVLAEVRHLSGRLDNIEPQAS